MPLRSGAAALAFAVLTCTAPHAVAQEPSTARFTQSAVDARLYATAALRSVILPVSQQAGSQRSNRTRRAIIGGVLGAVAGVATCTIISTAFFDESADGGISTCTAKGNIIFGGGGFALGALLGWSL